MRPLSALLFVVLAGGGITAAAFSQQVVNDQEQRLLDQRAVEAGGLLTLSGSRLQEAFRSMTTLLPLTGVAPAAFSPVAQPVIDAGLFDALAVVQAAGGGYQVLVSKGTGLEDGQAVPAEVIPTLGRAGSDGAYVSSPVFTIGDERRIGLAALVPGLSPRTLVYGQSAIDAPAEQEDSGTTRAFADLEAALYVGDRVDPDRLVIATPSELPLRGRTSELTVPIGADPFLLIVKARNPLVGDLARRQPWLFLAGGLLAAVLVSALVEVLLRRRRYALALVDERTAQLESSLRELDAAQHRLVTQERLAAVGELASAVGHELRNPLGVISNVLYLLTTRGDRDEAWVDRQLRTAEREVNAAVLIVSDLLGFARPREPILEEVTLPTLVDEALSVAPPPDGIEVAKQWPEPLPPLRADRDLLRQVVLNLVTNAYDAMPEGGLLVLEAESDATGVRLTVSDTGGGMDDDTRSHLFEPFFTTKAKGIGLGLAVAQRIVQAHGGTVTVKSRPGTGASFSVTLPTATVRSSVAR